MEAVCFFTLAVAVTDSWHPLCFKFIRFLTFVCCRKHINPFVTHLQRVFSSLLGLMLLCSIAHSIICTRLFRGKMHSDWFSGIEILQGSWQHGEKVGYCYPSGLVKTLCKWDIYVPLVTKGLKPCILELFCNVVCLCLTIIFKLQLRRQYVCLKLKDVLLLADEVLTFDVTVP
jgi:hypothetical protein